MKPKSIALVTCAEYPNLPDEERLMIAPLADLGITSEIKIWDDPQSDWGKYDAVILRATWDYHFKASSFLKWLDLLEIQKINVYNPAPILKWNVEKTYLREIASRGLPTVPTLWIPFESTAGLLKQIEQQWWARAIVKPTVSGGAHQTFLIDPSRDSTVRFPYPVGLPLMVQPYLPEIEEQGEWSFVFFGGQFSHCVLKKPRQGDFRVQIDHGGKYSPEMAPPDGLELAEHILKTLAFPLLYARIDLVRQEDRFVIMELEFLEPALYLEYCASAPKKFADTIANALKMREI
jgi:glutathione synthase/RimK-type ligase-like ATP-grasp enzyme